MKHLVSRNKYVYCCIISSRIITYHRTRNLLITRICHESTVRIIALVLSSITTAEVIRLHHFFLLYILLILCTRSAFLL